jgi:CDP-diacylglycerol--glycerol-3-phosphate 3-phosphatidyltransferase/cardiolipin synthase
MLNLGNPLAYPVFLAAVTSDFLDGKIARHYNVSSAKGAVLDASADFILIASGITFYVVMGLVSPILLIVMTLSFIQYITTINVNVDDFLGKHVGTVLYLSLGVIMIFPLPIVGLIVSIIGAAYILIAFVSRLHKIEASKIQHARFII